MVQSTRDIARNDAPVALDGATVGCIFLQTEMRARRVVAGGAALQDAPQMEGTGIRRECLDQLIVRGEAHLRRALNAYAAYCNATRTHLGLHKDIPHRRPVERRGRIVTRDVL